MKNTENYREGLMHKSKKFMKEHKEYKKHSITLKEIQKEFERNGHKFNNMNDVENIILMLRLEVEDNDFIEDVFGSDDGNNDIERTPTININSKPY